MTSWPNLDTDSDDCYPHRLLIQLERFGGLRQRQTGLIQLGCFAHLFGGQWLTSDDDAVGSEDAEDGGLGDTVLFGEDGRGLT